MKIFEVDKKADKEIVNVTPLIGQVELAFGAQGEEVRTLQRALQAVGISPGPIDKIFGRQTKAAVIVFQNSVDIDPDGIAGPITLTNLQDVLDGKKELRVKPKPSPKQVKIKGLPRPENARIIFDEFQKHGFNDIQAAAWVGCISGESMNNPNSIGTEYNKKTGATYNSYGLCQWNLGRYDNLKKFAKQKSGSPDGWKNNIELQIEYAMWELRNWDKIMGSKAVDPLDSIRPHRDSLEKTLYNLIAHFEKPQSNDAAFKQRLPWAKTALGSFGTTDIK